MTDSEDREIKPHWDATKLSQTEMWTEKRRLATAMRLVIERLVPSNAPVDELRRAADGLERYAEALKDHPRLKDARLFAESANAGNVGAFFDQSPLIGLANPLAPPLTIGRKDDRPPMRPVFSGLHTKARRVRCMVASSPPPSTRYWATSNHSRDFQG